MPKKYIIAWLALLTVGVVIIWLFPSGETIQFPSGTTPEQRTASQFESIRNQPGELLAFLREMPKGGDLHTHLSGAVYAETLVAWAAQTNKCIDPIDFKLFDVCKPEHVRLQADLSKTDPLLYRRMIDAWSTRNWERSGKTGHDQFFTTFPKFSLVTDRFGEMLAEMRSRARAENVSYVEVMLTPESVSKKLGEGVNVTWNTNFAEMRTLLRERVIKEAVKSGVEALDKAEEQMNRLLRCDLQQPADSCQVQVRYIFQISRASVPGSVFAQMLTAFEMASVDPRLVGLNLVQPEDNPVALRDFVLHMRMLDFFHSAYPKVNIALHAGELAPGLVPPEALRFHIQDSVEVGHAKRIGHGVALMHEDNVEGLLRTMATNNIMVEICLTSNDLILGVRGTSHPLRKYLANGVPVALATDDEGVARSDMSREYLKAVQDQGLNYAELKTMARTSLEHAFISGGSLWKNRKTFEMIPECLQDSPAAASVSFACQQYLNNSERARLQWNLEKQFAEFERQY